MPPRILVFDNYDSFTYNLVHLVEKIMHAKVDVVLNDQVNLADIERYDKVILSPGPGLPSEAGLLMALIRQYWKTKSILGVCLGHQAIAESFGGALQNLDDVCHGVATPIQVLDTNHGIFSGLPPQFEVGRYHSWIVSKKNLPDCFNITSVDEAGHIMSMQHRDANITGVQFHPESILTPFGDQIIRNWLNT